MTNARGKVSPSSLPVWLVQTVVFLAAALSQYLFWRWNSPGMTLAGALPVVIAALLLSFVAAWSSGQILRTSRRQQQLLHRLEQSETDFQQIKLFLNSSIRMDAELLEAADEEQVMNVTLSVISDLAGAAGASFVPLDEWGQPLPAYVYGTLPTPQRKSLLERLSTAETRQSCRNCRQHQALPGNFCPLVDGPFQEPTGLVCFPLKRADRLLGMVNLHLPGSRALTSEQTAYLTGLLNEAALAVETVRLRSRETSTLSQIQMLRPAQLELSTLLPGLLEGLRQALEVEAVRMVVRELPSASQPGLSVSRGNAALFDHPGAGDVLQQVFDRASLVFPAGSASPAFAGVPAALPDGRLTGAILLAAASLPPLDERKTAILRSVADQAALLVENERMIRDIEYRTLIQERARLAREIHDGLAQTLAFLKLQASQMQNYLAQGNLARLSLILKQNYETLAEAYLDTRQVIDSLRLNPEQGLAAWLEQMLVEFETASGLPVERQFLFNGESLSPEVQAQLMRIVQEALNNIRKHARARVVRVTVKEWNGDVVVEVRDDGQGFSPTEVPGLSQYGLRGMRERAELIGADFQVISKPQEGTIVRLSVPKYSQEPLK